jgi:hypothetical protein
MNAKIVKAASPFLCIFIFIARPLRPVHNDSLILGLKRQFGMATEVSLSMLDERDDRPIRLWTCHGCCELPTFDK